jgi:hypothetical protein
MWIGAASFVLTVIVTWTVEAANDHGNRDTSSRQEDPFVHTFASGDADQVIPLRTASDISVSNAGDCGMHLTYSNRAGEREFASAVLFGTGDSYCNVAYSVNQFGYYEPWAFARNTNDNITFVGTQGVPVQGIAFQVCEIINNHYDPANCVTVERLAPQQPTD